MTILIPYGLKDGALVHIDDVSSGLTCDCLCLNCGGALIARKGLIRENHFAHRSGLECAGLAEGVLHRLAKEILCSLNRFEVPAYHWERSKQLPFGQVVHHQKKLTRAGEIEVLKSYAEFRLPPDFVPDVVLYANSAHQEPKALFVEIIVTHGVNRLKRRKIRRHGVPTLEINLTKRDLDLHPEELRAKLEGLSKGKRWIFHPKQVKCEKEFVAEFRRRRKERVVPEVSISRSDLSDWSTLKNPADSMESNRAIEEFFQRHKRYPSIEETTALFKELIKRK